MSKNVALPYGYSFAELNSNVLVFDRTGKSNVEGKITSDAIEHFLVPNILSANTHMVIADPSGALCAATKDELKNNGYDVKVFDFCHPDLKLAFNPFHIWDNETIRLFAECLAKEERPSDQFFSRGLLEYLQIIMLLVLRHAPNKYHTLSGVYEFIQMTSKNGCNPNDSLRYILYGKEDVPNFHNETVKNFLKLWKNTNSRFGPVSENPDGKSLDELGWSKDIIERSRLILGISKSVGNRAFNICASYIFRPFVISPVKEMFEKYVFDLKEFRNPGRIALFITGYSKNSSFAGLTKYL
ncbi:MAG: type IV secretory system conjugative DNA transfer family protein, partial [Lachnospiraceae bacterium]|nr:type IV secretory system conjugative DNA transfer family protein [Lachnospiraceae bacterium]